MRKTYVGIVRDHSGSMSRLATKAANDYNLTIDGIKKSMELGDQAAFVTVVECGVGYLGSIIRTETNTPIDDVKRLSQYHTTGSYTPLWGSVGEAITALETMQKLNDPEAAFLVMVITDGADNKSVSGWSGNQLSRKIQELQMTDKWTFVFRVPKGNKYSITRIGIPEDNVLEWEQTEESLVQSTQATVKAMDTYFADRSRGITRSTSFYDKPDTSKLTTNTIKAIAEDMTSRLSTFQVGRQHDTSFIKDFVEVVTGKPYRLGHAYYQLSKKEKVQASKDLCIRDKSTKKIYGGFAVRGMLGLPPGDIKVAPEEYGKYDIFVKSTSVNRKLVGGTDLLYLN